MIADITAIIVAAAAVIGLVPLGIRTIHDMIKNHRRKKSSEMWLTVGLSVIASHMAPAVVTELSERLGAVTEQLPPWAKAALGSLAQAPEEKPAAPQTSQDESRPADPANNGRVTN